MRTEPGKNPNGHKPEGDNFWQNIKEDIDLVNQLMPELFSDQNPEEKEILKKVTQELLEFEKLIDKI